MREQAIQLTSCSTIAYRQGHGGSLFLESFHGDVARRGLSRTGRDHLSASCINDTTNGSISRNILVQLSRKTILFTVWKAFERRYLGRGRRALLIISVIVREKSCDQCCRDCIATRLRRCSGRSNGRQCSWICNLQIVDPLSVTVKAPTLAIDVLSSHSAAVVDQRNAYLLDKWWTQKAASS